MAGVEALDTVDGAFWAVLCTLFAALCGFTGGGAGFFAGAWDPATDGALDGALTGAGAGFLAADCA